MRELIWIKGFLLGQRSGVEQQSAAGTIHLEISFFFFLRLNPQPRKKKVLHAFRRWEKAQLSKAFFPSQTKKEQKEIMQIMFRR